MLVRAGTGTGKTLGFLLPIFSNLATSSSSLAVIISPARELAEQTLAQAITIGRECGLTAEPLVGGIRKASADRAALTKLPRVLVATPGRILDHLDNAPGFRARLEKDGAVLVLDEVDRLLDPGFRPAVMRVAAAMSSPQRQTLLFTATADANVRQVAKQLLKGDDAYVDASPDKPQSLGVRNDNVVQQAVVVPPERLLTELVHALQGPLEGHVVVFVPTAAMASLLAAVLRSTASAPTAPSVPATPAGPQKGGGQLVASPIFEIHSRMDQKHRSRAVREFTESKNAIMIATDVFARGIDVNGVKLVVQLGIAPDNAQVSHRIGRTGRGGSKGRALMILAESERAVLNVLIDKEKMPITVVKPLDNASVKTVRVPRSRDTCRTFIATLGFYKAQAKRLGWGSADLVPNVRAMFGSFGIEDAKECPVSKKTIKKMGISGDQLLVV
jgi:ATP-dependent RNA helicase MSS116